MNEHDENDEVLLSPEEEAEVSRLLAEAGGPIPMPAAVEARLRSVLDELAEQRPAEGATVVPLRTRRRWPRMLLAAAAVLVGGYGVGTLVSQGTLSGTDASTSADSAAAGSVDSLDSGALESAPEAGDLDDQAADSERAKDGVPKASSSYSRAADPVRIRSERLDVGVRRALLVLSGTRTLAELDGPDRVGSRACGPPGVVMDDDSLQVTYDRRPAVLVTRPLDGGLVEVTVYSCAGVELDGTVVAQVGP